MYTPKKSKFKKQQKGTLPNYINNSVTSNQLHFGSLGLKAMSFAKMTSKQVETMRQFLNKSVRKTGHLIIKLFPNQPISQKPLEVRMGKGKGSVDHWAFKIKPGFILCEIVTDQLKVAKRALILLKKKINIKTKIIQN
jgi:large subunit ribosomal protein L16